MQLNIPTNQFIPADSELLSLHFKLLLRYRSLPYYLYWHQAMPCPVKV